MQSQRRPCAKGKLFLCSLVGASVCARAERSADADIFATTDLEHLRKHAVADDELKHSLGGEELHAWRNSSLAEHDSLADNGLRSDVSRVEAHVNDDLAELGEHRSDVGRLEVHVNDDHAELGVVANGRIHRRKQQHSGAHDAERAAGAARGQIRDVTWPTHLVETRPAVEPVDAEKTEPPRSGSREQVLEKARHELGEEKETMYTLMEHHQNHSGTELGDEGFARLQPGQAAAHNDSSELQDGNESAEVLKKEDELEKESGNAFTSSFNLMGKATNDPRGFFLENKAIQSFVAGLRMAVQMSSTPGKCLTTGQFEGYGCAEDSKTARICECPGLFQECYAPDDTSQLMPLITKGQFKQAIEKAQVILFGKCQLSLLKILVTIAVSAVVVLGLGCGAIAFLKKKKRKHADDDD